MSTGARTPWRDRRHVGITLHDHRSCVAAGNPADHPAAPPELRDGPPGVIRDWPAFTLAILEVDPERRAVRIVGPRQDPRAPLVERYTVRLPAGGESELRSRLRQVVDARQAAWCASAGHAILPAGCPLHASAR